tara:strand:+ start:69 stop:320 length:252 start_codon:yes stop_codon:yes gene_type:complete
MTIAGISLYEDPQKGDEGPMAIKHNSIFYLTPFYDEPGRDELLQVYEEIKNGKGNIAPWDGERTNKIYITGGNKQKLRKPLRS